MKVKNIRLRICLALMSIIISGTTNIIAVTSGYNDSVDKDSDIMVGYIPSSYKKETGYHIEHFGFIGGHFSRVIREYDTIDCCKPSGNKMDGCSAPTTCPNS